MVEVGAVRLNGRAIKPSAEIKAGDRIEVAFPRRVISADALTADEKELKRGVQAINIIEERRVNEDENPWA